jgi:hypothetical protein
MHRNVEWRRIAHRTLVNIRRVELKRPEIVGGANGWEGGNEQEEMGSVLKAMCNAVF